jgi:osmotically-inducible protein OsmY
MAIFDFLRNKGKKLLGGSGSQSGSSARSGDPRQQQQFSGNTGQQQSGGGSRSSGAPGSGAQGSGASQKDADTIRDHIKSQGNVDAPDDLVVLFDADDGVVVIEGTVPNEDTAEAIVLVAGDIEGVCAVDDRMRVKGRDSRSPQPRNEQLQRNLRGSSQGASPGSAGNSPAGTSK